MKPSHRIITGLLAVLPFTAIGAGSPAHSATQLNGADLPGVMARSLKEQRLLQAPDGKGGETIVTRTTRAPGTRTPLHRHDYGGTTCVLEGEMTLYREGVAPKRAVAGQCYYMPANSEMAGVNTGTVNAVMLDIFQLPAGKPVWSVVEDKGKALQDQFDVHEHKH